MSESTPHTPDYNYAFKERLRLLPFFIVLYAIVWWLNNGLWRLDTVVIWSVVILFIPVKLGFIILRSVQLWRIEKKMAFLLIFLPIMLMLAHLFDFQAIPYLWTYRLGTETKGTVIELIKTSKSRFVDYEYLVGNTVFQKRQDTSIQYYESLATGTVVTVKYDPGNPKMAFLMDLQELKKHTLFTLLMGFGTILILYMPEIQEKVSLLIKNHFQVSKPA
jgi:hypothetical protein